MIIAVACTGIRRYHIDQYGIAANSTLQLGAGKRALKQTTGQHVVLTSNFQEGE